MRHVTVEVVYKSFETFDELEPKIAYVAGRVTARGGEAVCAALWTQQVNGSYWDFLWAERTAEEYQRRIFEPGYPQHRDRDQVC